MNMQFYKIFNIAGKSGILLLLAAAFSCAAWDFKGENDGLILSWKPVPGRFAVTLAFQITVPARVLEPGYRSGSVFYPLTMSAYKPGKGDFSGVTMCFVTKPDDRYCFIRTNREGRRFNLFWSSGRNEIPTDKPVWVFISAAAGNSFDIRVDRRCYSDLSGDRPLGLFSSAGEYRIHLGYNPWRGGVGFMECSIDNFMIFDRTLSRAEMAQIEKDPASGAELPGLCKFTVRPFVKKKRLYSR